MFGILFLLLSVSHSTIVNDIATFKEWIASFPNVEINIEPYWFGDQLGVGAIATRNLDVGDIYASLPPTVIISEATARSHEGLESMCSDIPAMDVRQTSMDCLILLMVLEVT